MKKTINKYFIKNSPNQLIDLISFYCGICGEKIGTAEIYSLQNGVNTKPKIKFEGEILKIARDCNINAYFNKNGAFFKCFKCEKETVEDSQ